MDQQYYAEVMQHAEWVESDAGIEWANQWIQEVVEDELRLRDSE